MRRIRCASAASGSGGHRPARPAGAAPARTDRVLVTPRAGKVRRGRVLPAVPWADGTTPEKARTRLPGHTRQAARFPKKLNPTNFLARMLRGFLYGAGLTGTPARQPWWSADRRGSTPHGTRVEGLRRFFNMGAAAPNPPQLTGENKTYAKCCGNKTHVKCQNRTFHVLIKPDNLTC